MNACVWDRLFNRGALSGLHTGGRPDEWMAAEDGCRGYTYVLDVAPQTLLSMRRVPASGISAAEKSIP